MENKIKQYESLTCEEIITLYQNGGLSWMYYQDGVECAIGVMRAIEHKLNDYKDKNPTETQNYELLKAIRNVMLRKTATKF